MKKILLLFFVWFNVTLAQSNEITPNDSTNITDENNLKQGHWIIYGRNKKVPGYADDQKVEEGPYKDSKKQGMWKAYFNNGRLKNELTFINNRANGYAKMYYENGNLAEEGMWKDNKWIGPYKYFHENGNIAKEWNHDETGKRVGVQKYFHENGKVAIEGEWKDGKESGVIKEYFPNGDLKSEKNFAEGALDASSVKTFESKSTAVIEEKPAPAPDPVPVKIAEDKKPASVGVFDGTGYNKTKDKNGKLLRDGMFEKGRFIEGKEYIYDEGGQLSKTKIYKGGRVIEEKEE